MISHSTPRLHRTIDASRAALILAGAAVAVLVGLLLIDGGAHAVLAGTAATAGFAAFVGACRMLGRV